MTDDYRKTIRHYSDEAERLFEKYEATTAAYFNFIWKHIAPPPAHILDIGSGSGKDASIYVEKGYFVTAIEPAQGLRELAAKNHTSPNITWLDDRLPELTTFNDQKTVFDHVHINCVLMHLMPQDIPAIMETVHRVLKNDGTLYLSLRQGPNDPLRPMFPISKEMIAQFGEGFFTVIAQNSVTDEERPDVAWDKMFLKKIT